MTPSKKTYPEYTVRRVLNDASGKHASHTNGRFEAACVLLNQFAALAKEYRLPVKVEDREALRLFGTREETLILVRPKDGNIYVATGKGDTPIKLNYNPQEHCFEGVDVDPNVAPEPGKLLPRVSPLVVLAQEVLRLTKHYDD
ncbi:hypothetical protein ACIHQR_21150 [Corallococcus coralloides]|uniref:hypothetical protein n=1 Tax=Corallococcus coralloides TaxID=184914 RepID=UPI00384B992C